MRWTRLRRRRANESVGPIDCAAAAAVIHQYLDGELDEGTTHDVSRHLDACRQCGLSADTWRSIKTAIARSQPPEPDALHRLRLFADSIAERVGDSASPDA